MFSLRKQKLLSCCVAISIAVVLLIEVRGFSGQSARSAARQTPTRSLGSRSFPTALMVKSNDEISQPTTATKDGNNNVLVSMALVTALSLSPLNAASPAHAYAESDYASDTVQNVVKSLKDAAGNEEQTFQAYENIAEIIAEGKGVGGNVDYKGVTLDRGYIADEDTSIYNPGLTLLTEGEKERLVESLMNSRKAGIDKKQWSEKSQSAYAYLKVQLDPLHMTELRGYLKIVPFYVGVLYLGVLAVQQNARGLFTGAYIGAVLAVVAPALILLLTAS